MHMDLQNRPPPTNAGNSRRELSAGLGVLVGMLAWAGCGGVEEARPSPEAEADTRATQARTLEPCGTGWRTLSAGWTYNLAVRDDGTVWAWGDNDHGQLGDGTQVDQTRPVKLAALSTPVQAVSAGYYHSLALLPDNTVRAWGRNHAGQLGNGSLVDSPTPVTVPGLTNVRAISAGGWHSLALKWDGTVMAWGHNNDGQLGDDSLAQRTTPVPVTGLTNVVAIHAGYAYSMALKADGTLWAWGRNTSGQLGNGSRDNSRVPGRVGSLENVRAFVAETDQSFALLADGTLRGWGANAYGQLGDGSRDDQLSPVPVLGLNNVRSVDTGQQHTVAVTADGTVWTWGRNSFGQLGDGTPSYRTTPVALQGLAMFHPHTAAAGVRHSLTLDTKGTVWGWGENTEGQLGDGSLLQRNTPQCMPAVP